MDTATGLVIGAAAIAVGYAWKKSRSAPAPAAYPQYAYEGSPYGSPYGSTPYSNSLLSSAYSRFGVPQQFQQYAPNESDLDPQLAKIIGTGITAAPQLITSLANAIGDFGNFAFGDDPVPVESVIGADPFESVDLGFDVFGD